MNQYNSKWMQCTVQQMSWKYINSVHNLITNSGVNCYDCHWVSVPWTFQTVRHTSLYNPTGKYQAPLSQNFLRAMNWAHTFLSTKVKSRFLLLLIPTQWTLKTQTALHLSPPTHTLIFNKCGDVNTCRLTLLHKMYINDLYNSKPYLQQFQVQLKHTFQGMIFPRRLNLLPSMQSTVHSGC